MPVVMLADLQAAQDRKYGDVKVALTAELDDAGEPVDYVALRGALRLSKERRAKLRELQARFDAIGADAPEVAEQRTKVHAAQNRLDTASDEISDRARRELAERVAAEQARLDELAVEHAPDEGAQEDEMRAVIVELLRAVAANPARVDDLVAAVSTEEAPNGDLPYLLGIFETYIEGGELGEASPSES